MTPPYVSMGVHNDERIENELKKKPEHQSNFSTAHPKESHQILLTEH